MMKVPLVLPPGAPLDSFGRECGSGLNPCCTRCFCHLLTTTFANAAALQV
jgi:hypothetical protein